VGRPAAPVRVLPDVVPPRHDNGGSIAAPKRNPVRDLSTGVAQRSAIPIGALLIAALFLLVQDRLDRRDPKLALAPLGPPTVVEMEEDLPTASPEGDG